MLDLTFILASVTCLKPFVRPFHSGYVVSTTPASGYASTSKNLHRDAYVELSAVKSAAGNEDGAIIQTRRGRDSRGYKKSAVVYRPDQVDQEATVSSANEGQPYSKSHDMSISRTQAWPVSYEDDEILGGARR